MSSNAPEMRRETPPNHVYRDPSPDRHRLGSNLSPQTGGSPGVATPSRKKLTGPNYLKNILNSDSEPELEPSSSSSKRSSSKQPERHRRRGPTAPPQPPSDDAADYLRRQLCLLPGIPVDLWAIADPPDGQKPFASLPTLVKLAIHGSPRKRLTLRGICDALIARFTWFYEHRRDDAWKNSVRHNLSLNKVFRKIPRDVTQLGKGCHWELDFTGGEGHKRPRKRRKHEKCPASDHDESESVETPEGTPQSFRIPLLPPEEENPAKDPDALILVQPYPPVSTGDGH